MLDTQNRFFRAEVNRDHKNLTQLLRLADEMLGRAKDLRADGKLAEALDAAVIAAGYVNAARSLERLKAVTLQ